MSVLDIKNDLLRLIVETNDARLLEMVRHYFKVLKEEPISAEEIDAQELRMIELGLKQVEEGKVISHEEVRSKVKALFDAKSKYGNS